MKYACPFETADRFGEMKGTRLTILLAAARQRHDLPSGQSLPERPSRVLEGFVWNSGTLGVVGCSPDRILKIYLGDAALEDVADHLAAIGAPAAPHIDFSCAVVRSRLGVALPKGLSVRRQTG